MEEDPWSSVKNGGGGTKLIHVNFISISTYIKKWGLAKHSAWGRRGCEMR